MNQWNDYLARFLTSRRAKGLGVRSVRHYEVNLTVYLKWLDRYPALPADEAETK